MVAAVADTHAALWLLLGDPRLSVAARNFIDRAAADRHKIVLSPISLAEVVYLTEKKRLPPAAFDDLMAALADPEHVLEEAPLTAGVMKAMPQVPREDIPDMPDRIIAATAAYFNAPVISRDGRIRTSNVRTIW